ncbi:MAG: hypothetical protein NC908_05075 [Candidatus Omnitrophica bacterium]|nr:hypothetical protein [Candidatus Omnitrophota bacterium]
MRIYKKNLIVLFLGFAFWILNLGFRCYAEEITLLYTGTTHAMVYPCNCPLHPDGGVARRAQLIKQIRKNNPYTLVLDSGAFFAGGAMDEYSQNVQLDMQRTTVNLKAMELMRYDAVALSDDEFNFGWEFLRQNILKTNLAFLSCNIKAEVIKPYIIKNLGNVKVGIVGITSASVTRKAGSLEFSQPHTALQNTVEELRKNGAHIIILLSSLGENEDVKILNELKGVDIAILNHRRSNEEGLTKMGSTLLLKPAWQARSLGKLSITVSNNKIADYKLEEIPLSDKIGEDPLVVSILPECFSDINCKKEGFIGVCRNPGAIKSGCLFTKADLVKLTIIVPRDCIACHTQAVINNLKSNFPGLTVSYLYYPDKEAGSLIKNLEIKTLPAYILGREVEKERGFDNLKENMELRGNLYVLKPQYTGVGYFLDRNIIKDRLDLFISLYDKSAPELLEMIKEFNPEIHFLAIEKQTGFEAAKGNLEVEEYLRAVCVKKYYPQYFWDYLICRAKNINSSWWQDCLFGSDTDKIRVCARSEEASALLRENIQLGGELKIMFGPVYMVDNQQIFGFEGVPKKEEFEKIVARER